MRRRSVMRAIRATGVPPRSAPCGAELRAGIRTITEKAAPQRGVGPPRSLPFCGSVGGSVLLEAADRLAQPGGELRQLLRPHDEKDHREDDQELAHSESEHACSPFRR